VNFFPEVITMPACVDIEKHLNYPMLLSIGCRQRTNFLIPAELIRLAGAIGMRMEIAAMYD
jgi:hypothetical protein